MTYSIEKRVAAEFLGTAALVFFGCGSAVIAGASIGVLGVALTFGLTLMMLVYAIGPISGCHVNPAVTLAMYVNGRITSGDALRYATSQVLGGLFGAMLIYLITGNIEVLGQNGYDNGSPAGYGFQSALTAEVILTAFFVFAVLGSTSANAPAGFAGLAIGVSLAVVYVIGLPVTGASVNPARSFGPAMLTGGLALHQVWLFIVAPVLGSFIGGFIYKTFTDADAKPAKTSKPAKKKKA